MSSSKPAVETLTAEIRVLQVGAKPVTLSAARQLDCVDTAEIRPFGRVRIDAKPADGLVEVIGSADGVLVRSSVLAREVRCPGYADSSPPLVGYGPPRAVCPQHRQTSVTQATSRSHHNWMEYTPSQELYEEWLALPLIVLAGLR